VLTRAPAGTLTGTRLPVAAHVADIGHDLVFDVARIPRLTSAGFRHRQAAIHPGELVDAVDREDANAPLHEQWLDRLDQPEALVLQKVGRGRGEEQDGLTTPSIRHDRHFQAERGAAPAIDPLRQRGVDKLWGHDGES
jgi:hypothetical protein